MKVWVLNLDAEEELAAGRFYRPKQQTQQLVRAKRELLRGSLVQPGDLILDADTPAPDLHRALEREAQVHLWSPTPSAQTLARSRGFEVPRAPTVGCLREVNARSFAAALHQALKVEDVATGDLQKVVVTGFESALEVLTRPAELGWLVRRPFGAAGRGRRRFHCGTQGEGEQAWLRASLAVGALVIEPLVQVEHEFTRSGFVDARGHVTQRTPCLQATDSNGAWTESRAARSADLPDELDARLDHAFFAAGLELHRAGYFGPFGIDGFSYRNSRGEKRLNALSEINARFTMDWAESTQPAPFATGF